MKKKKIKSTISFHGDTQIEMTSDYHFKRKSTDFSQLENKQQYEVDIFLFFPQQMNINPGSYSQDDFYSDLRPFVRLKEPQYSYKDYMGISKRKILSPLDKIKKIYEKMPHPTQEWREERRLISACRFFVSSYSHYFSKRTQRRARSFEKLFPADVSEDKKQSMLLSSVELLDRVSEVYGRWSSFLDQMIGSESCLSDKTKEELRLIDEYAFSCLYNGLLEILRLVQSIGAEETEKVKVYQARMRAHVDGIQSLSKSRQYMQIHAGSSLIEKEAYVMRQGALKRRVSQVLFLSMKEKTSFAFQRQFGYMIAAGFAGLWAIIANILIWTKLHISGYQKLWDGSSTETIGLGTYFVLFIFILVYILKDRIKEVSRALFARGGLWGQFFDSSRKLWYENYKGKKQYLGTVDESMSFVKSYEDLPSHIIESRKKTFINSLMFDEQVIVYKTRVTLFSKKISKEQEHINAIRIVVRLNLQRYISFLDKPLKTSYAFKGGSSEVSKIQLPKIYCIDMIVRCHDKGSNETYHELKRMYINHNHLVRIEDIPM